MHRTIEQERARAAWADVEAAPRDPKAFSLYSQLLQGLPVAIHTAGFGQTIAFYRAKARKKAEYQQVLDHLAGWLLREQTRRTDSDLMVAIQNGDTSSYRRLTAEALAYLAWLKRFAAAKAPDTDPATDP